MIGNKVANRITKVSKNLQQTDLKTVTTEKQIAKERYISPEKIKGTIDELKYQNNLISKSHKSSKKLARK